MALYSVNTTCSHCGRQSTFKINTLLDKAMSPEIEEKLFSGDLFKWTCPFCKAVDDISYSCLYHDGSKGLLIGLADNEKDEADMLAVLSGSNHRDELDEAINDWLKTCKPRLVRDPMMLQEKVLINYFNLDDRIVEIAKTIYKKNIESENPDIHITDMFLNHSEDGYVFAVFNNYQFYEEVEFSKADYLQLDSVFANRLENNNDLIIDEEWALKFIDNN